jgi:hypothetical protein
VPFRAELSARLERALGKIKHRATRRTIAPSEKSEYDVIADLKKERAAPGYKRLIRRLRTRLKRLESQDPNIYPLW